MNLHFCLRGLSKCFFYIYLFNLTCQAWTVFFFIIFFFIFLPTVFFFFLFHSWFQLLSSSSSVPGLHSPFILHSFHSRLFSIPDFIVLRIRVWQNGWKQNIINWQLKWIEFTQMWMWSNNEDVNRKHNRKS